MHEEPGGQLTVALNGATGFIGRRIQRHLLDSGHTVRVLLRPGTHNRRYLDARASVIEVALSDAAGLADGIRDVDAVIYCAGIVRGRDFADFRAVNVDGLATVCAVAAARPQPPRLLLISSLAATRPYLSHYARSKHDGEQVVQRWPTLDWTILRPPAVYGPGDVELRPLFLAMRAGLALRIGPSTQRLSLLHVDDLASAVSAWLKASAQCAQRSFEIDDGQPAGHGWEDLRTALRGSRPALVLSVPRRLLEIFGQANLLLARLLRRSPMLTPGKVRELSELSWLCDNSAFTAVTGWRPQRTLRDGVQTLFD